MDERLALAGAGVGEKGAQFGGRGKESGDVEIDATSEDGIGDKRGLGHAVAGEVGGREAIERGLPGGPDGGRDGGFVEGQGRFPLGLRGRGRGSSAGALVDPSGDGVEFDGGEGWSAERHTRGAGAIGAEEQETGGAVAGFDGRAASAAFEEIGVGRERESAGTLFLAVAGPALRGENRVPLTGVIDSGLAEGGGGRQCRQQAHSNPQEVPSPVFCHLLV